jgi:hypothetical protein
LRGDEGPSSGGIRERGERHEGQQRWMAASLEAAAT